MTTEGPTIFLDVKLKLKVLNIYSSFPQVYYKSRKYMKKHHWYPQMSQLVYEHSRKVS